MKKIKFLTLALIVLLMMPLSLLYISASIIYPQEGEFNYNSSSDALNNANSYKSFIVDEDSGYNPVVYNFDRLETQLKDNIDYLNLAAVNNDWCSTNFWKIPDILDEYFLNYDTQNLINPNRYSSSDFANYYYTMLYKYSFLDETGVKQSLHIAIILKYDFNDYVADDSDILPGSYLQISNEYIYYGIKEYDLDPYVNNCIYSVELENTGISYTEDEEDYYTYSYTYNENDGIVIDNAITEFQFDGMCLYAYQADMTTVSEMIDNYCSLDSDAGNVFAYTYTVATNTRDMELANSINDYVRLYTKNNPVTLEETSVTTYTNKLITADTLKSYFIYEKNNVLYGYWNDNYSSNSTNAGTYTFAFNVYDLEGKIWTTTLSVVVEPDTISPTIDTDLNIPINVDNPLTNEEILANIHATDETDGDISDRIILISTTYDSKNLVLGSYDFVVSVSDNAGNTTTETFIITLYDITKPIIAGKDSYSISYDEELTLEEIEANITLSDNYTATENLTLNIVSDGYCNYIGKRGNYKIIFNTVDEALNTSDNFIVSIEIYDLDPPIITAPSTIEIGTNTLLSLDELKAKINVYDEHDGNINYTIINYDAYKASYKIVGTYPIVITATDSAANPASYTLNIITSDDILPEIYVYRDFVISVAKGQKITNEMIISYLEQIGEIDAASVASVNANIDTEKVGTYAVSILLDDDSTYTTKVSVVEYDEEGAPIPEYEYNITNIFKGEFWKNFGQDLTNGIWKWPHIVSLVILVVIFCFVVGCFVKRRK